MKVRITKVLLIIIIIMLLAAGGCTQKQLKLEVLDSGGTPVTKNLNIALNGKHVEFTEESGTLVIKNADILDVNSLEVYSGNYYSYKLVDENDIHSTVTFNSDIRLKEQPDTYVENDFIARSETLKEFSLTNTGFTNQIQVKLNALQNFSVRDIKVIGRDKDDFKILALGNKSVQANHELTIPVEFKPSTEGEKEAELVLSIFNGNRTEKINYTLTGTAVTSEETKPVLREPVFSLLADGYTTPENSYIDFGSVPIDTTGVNKTLYVKNIGNLPMGVKITFHNFDNTFQINDDYRPLIEKTILPRSGYEFNLQFDPRLEKTYDNALIIEINETSGSSLKHFSLRGVGAKSSSSGSMDPGQIASEAQSSLNSKNYPLAERLYTKLLNSQHRNPGYYYNRGIAYYEMGNYSNAIADFDKAFTYRNYFAQEVAKERICSLLYLTARTRYQIYFNSRQKNDKENAINACATFLSEKNCNRQDQVTDIQKLLNEMKSQY